MTNTTKKMTKREKFQLALTLDAVKNNAILNEFFNSEIEKLDVRSAKAKTADRKPTKREVVNNGIKETILEIFRNEPDRMFTATEVTKALGNEEYSVNKISALLRQLYKDENPVIGRTEDKGRAYFHLLEMEE